MTARHVGVESGTSSRLLPRFRPAIFKIHKMVGPTSAVLMDPDTQSTRLGFSQPVHVDRLRLFDLAEMDIPIRDDGLLLEIFRGNVWKKYRVISQSATGRVEIVEDDSQDGSSEWIDLASEEHRWIQQVLPDAPAAPARRRLRVKQGAAAGPGDGAGGN